MKSPNKPKSYCSCCGETNPALLAKITKPRKDCLCKSCLHGSLHNGGVCPAAEEHANVKFYRIGVFVFINGDGQKQFITMDTDKTLNTVGGDNVLTR